MYRERSEVDDKSIVSDVEGVWSLGWRDIEFHEGWDLGLCGGGSNGSGVDGSSRGGGVDGSSGSNGAGDSGESIEGIVYRSGEGGGSIVYRSSGGEMYKGG